MEWYKLQKIYPRFKGSVVIGDYCFEIYKDGDVYLFHKGIGKETYSSFQEILRPMRNHFSSELIDPKALCVIRKYW